MLRRLKKLVQPAKAAPPAAAADPIGEAVSHHQRGELERAKVLYERLLETDPRHFDALHLRGVVALQQGENGAALDWLARALEVSPEHPKALHSYARAQAALGDHEAAVATYRRAVAAHPGYAEAFSNLGLSLHELRRYPEALESFERAVALKPAFLEGQLNLARTLGKVGRTEDSLACYERILARHPDMAEAWIGRGVLLDRLRRGDEALASYDRALALDPANAKALSNRGNLLFARRQLREALEHYDRAIQSDPGLPEAYVNRGHALRRSGDTESALANFDCAIELRPRYAAAHFARGETLRDLGREDEALAAYLEADALEPEMDCLQGNILHVHLDTCAWGGLAAQSARVAASIREGRVACAPFTALAAFDDPALHRACASAYVSRKFPPAGAAPKPAHSASDRIRLAYFSPDFREHSVAYLTAELFERHDRAAFEVTGYAFGPRTQDPMAMRLAQAFDRFVDVRDLSDADVVAHARELGVDIAVDLAGHTEHARTGIFAHRAAPVQASYIGYLGTLGAEYFDYLVADETIIPPGAERHYVEKIAYVPCYQVNDSRRSTGAKDLTRAELGLPPEGFVFCCLNNAYKISPETFSSWMRILAAVPGSSLMLFAASAFARDNLRREAQARGIDPGRLVFALGLDREEYLARFRSLDLFLDTLPYNGGTVVSDALWTGLPVLTLTGCSFAGRMASSLVRAAGLPELVAGSREAYESTAIRCAREPHWLADLARRLAAAPAASPLFEAESFTRALEGAFRRMHARAMAGLPPETFRV